MKNPRFSQQRETILEIIKSSGKHVSVDVIYAEARVQMPRISLGTVYRNLKQLEELKQVCQTQGANQTTYYEPYLEPHHHFVCKECGLIKNLDNPTVKVCTGCISTSVPMKIDDIVTTLYGVCEACQ